MPTGLHGSPIHQALQEVVGELSLDGAPSELSRVIADSPSVDAAELPALAAHVLTQCGLDVRSAAGSAGEPKVLAQCPGAGKVLLGVSENRYVVLSQSLRRRVRAVSLADDGEFTRVQLRRRAVSRRIAEMGADCTWLVVARPVDLAPMAHPGGHLAPWQRLRALIKIERADVSVVALYAATAGALTLLIPIAVQALVNTIAFGTMLQPLIVLTLALFIGLGLAGAIAALQAYVVEVLQRRILIRVAEDLGERLPRVSERARDRRDLIELNNRFLDVITIQKSSTELLLTGLSLVLQMAAGMILLGFYHPVLLTFDLLIVGSLVLVVQLGRGGTESAVAESKAKFGIAAWLDELARSPQRFAGGSGREVAAEELSRRAHAYVKARRRHFRRVFSVLIGGVALQALSVVALLGIGGWLVIERQLTLGQLVAAEIVIGAIAVGVGKLGRLVDKAFDLVAATDKLGKLLDLPLRTEGGDPLPEGNGLALCGRDLRVGYGDGAVAVSGLSFDIDAGAKVLLDGRAGSGRSAVLEVLAGWRQPVTGQVRWDGRARPRVDDVAARVALVRAGEVVAGSVFLNLRIADAGLSSARAWAALAEVGLDRVVAELPGGLDCQLLPSGAPLSTSQVRRLAMARAVVGTPRLLLIDEALDGATDDPAEMAELCERLLGAQAPWTAVVATRSEQVRRYLERAIDLSPANPLAPAAGGKGGSR